ncbi:MAG: hypothetical protein GY757_13540 [bacterium]|nr:hypothetical protein [bacterium]
MKTKSFKKKLTLNKKTIANIGNEEMSDLKGGAITVTITLLCTRNVCLTADCFTRKASCFAFDCTMFQCSLINCL